MLTQASTSRRRTESYKYLALNEWHIKYTVLMAHNLKDIFKESRYILLNKHCNTKNFSLNAI